MKKIKKNLKWITLIVVMIIIAGAVFIKISLLKEEEVEPVVVENLELKEEEKEENSQDEVVPVNVYVDIKGAVKKPGVYEIAEGKKVIDVVQLAGGLTEQADTSMVNLAKNVANEMVIIIYTVEEVKKAQEKDSIIKVVDNQCVCPQISNDACLNNKEEQEETTTGNTTTTEKININTATVDELVSLSGVGESKAEAIVAYRNENGKFKNIQDIMNVPGIGESLYEKIKDNITI